MSDTEKMDEALDRFIDVLKGTDIYTEYRHALEEVKKDPALKLRVDDFRKRNYNLQKSDEIDLTEYEKLRSDMVAFRAAEPVADAFFDAELALCRLVQKLTYSITESLDFE